jgi:hypothetical protein
MNREDIEHFFKDCIVNGIEREVQFLENPEEGRIEVDLVCPPINGRQLETVHLSFAPDRKGKIMFSQSFLSEINALAHQIALRQRGELQLQELPAVLSKFEAEKQELAEASEQWDELPDVCYYAAYMVVIGSEHASRDAISWLSAEIENRGVSVGQLESGTLVKYRLRATQPKNVELEQAAILAAVQRV